MTSKKKPEEISNFSLKCTPSKCLVDDSIEEMSVRKKYSTIQIIISIQTLYYLKFLTVVCINIKQVEKCSSICHNSNWRGRKIQRNDRHFIVVTMTTYKHYTIYLLQMLSNR